VAVEPLRAGDPGEIAGYRLGARLGAGGMGQVYLAFTRGGRPVALKVVRPDLGDDPDFRRRFRQEVAAARRVHGMYTAQVLDANPDATPPWLVTAYVPGPSLHQAVAGHGPMPPGTVALLMAGVAEALQAIHGAGVVHRDLKPSNVLLAPDGPRVIDFGIAWAAEATSVTRTGIRVGSPQYMAPEQVAGMAVSPAIDVFALGSLAAYAATGLAPFGEGAMEAVMYRVMHEQADLSRCPPPLRDLVQRCLAKEPADRPSLAAIVAECHDYANQTPQAVQSWLPPTVAAALAQHAPPPPPPSPPPGRTTPPPPPPGRPTPPAPTSGPPLPGRPPPAPSPPPGAPWTPPQHSPPHSPPPAGYPQPQPAAPQPVAARPGGPQPGGLQYAGQQPSGPRYGGPPYPAPQPGGTRPAAAGMYGAPARSRRGWGCVVVLAVIVVAAVVLAIVMLVRHPAAPTHGSDSGATQPRSSDSTLSSPSAPASSAPVTSGRNWFAGTWTGTADQPTGLIMHWTVRLILPAKGTIGRFALPSMHCSGQLFVTDSGSTTALVAEEVRSNPRGLCAQNGLMTLTRSGSGEMELTWQDTSNSSNVADGRLYRHGG
jgi:serine/threonine protein kinase